MKYLFKLRKKEITCDLLPTFFNPFNLNFSSVFFQDFINFHNFERTGILFTKPI